jgi:ribonuclease HI
MKLSIYTDGGSRGNPGKAAIGVVSFDEKGNHFFSISEKIGITTNNVAEYSAIIRSLKYLIENKIFPEEIIFFEDSLLVVSQLKGTYKVKDIKLKDLYIEIKQMLEKLNCKVSFNYIPREKNKSADRMVNLALDGNI